MNLRAFASRHVLVFFLGLAVLVLGLDRIAHAGSSGGGGDANRDLIAVTGEYGSGAAALYLIDTKTRQMAVYRIDGGRGLELVAARDTTYDFFLESYGDRSEPNYRPARLRAAWQRHLKEGGRGSFEGRDASGERRLPGGRTTGPDIAPIEEESGSGATAEPEPPSGRVTIPRGGGGGGDR